MKHIGKINKEVYDRLWELIEQGKTIDNLMCSTGYSSSTIYKIFKNPTWEKYQESLRRHAVYVYSRRNKTLSTEAIKAES